MTHLAKKLESHHLGECIQTKDLLVSIVPDFLQKQLDQTEQKRFYKIKRIFEQIGINTKESESYGFHFTIKGLKIAFGMEPYIDVEHDKKQDNLSILIQHGFPLSFVQHSSATQVILTAELYESEVEEVTEKIYHFLTSHLDELNQKLTEINQNMNAFLSTIIMEKNQFISVDEYKNMLTYLENSHSLPIIPLTITPFTVDSIQSELHQLSDSVLKQKILLGILPQVQTKWNKLNGFFTKSFHQQHLNEWDELIEKNYSYDIQTMIKEKNKRALLTKSVGFLWKEALLNHPVYAEIEEFVKGVRNDTQNDVYLYQDEKTVLPSVFPHRSFNPYLISIELRKKKNKDQALSIMCVIVGFDSKEKYASSSGTDIQLLRFDSIQKHLTDEDKRYAETFLLPTEEIVDKWLTEMKNRIDLFLEN